MGKVTIVLEDIDATHVSLEVDVDPPVSDSTADSDITLAMQCAGRALEAIKKLGRVREYAEN